MDAGGKVTLWGGDTREPSKPGLPERLASMKAGHSPCSGVSGLCNWTSSCRYSARNKVVHEAAPRLSLAHTWQWLKGTGHRTAFSFMAET